MSAPVKPAKRPHGRPPLPIGSHGTIAVYDLGEKARGDRFAAVTRVRDKDGVTRKVERRGPSRTQARNRLQEALRERLGAGTTKLKSTSRVREAAALYLAKVEAAVDGGEKSGTTLDAYRTVVDKHIVPRIGELRLHEADVAELQDFMDELAEVIGANARRQVRTVLRGCMQVAVRARAINANPVRELERIEGGGKPPRALTPAEREDLLAKLDSDRYARRADLPDLVRFMLGTGVRIAEALAVRWCDCNLDGELINETLVRLVSINGILVDIRGRGLVRNQGKTAAGVRRLPLPQFVWTMLETRRPEWAGPEDPIFPSGVRGWRWPNNAHRAWRGARTRAGYDWVTPHVFRKTASTELEREGLTVRQRGDHLGHAQLTTTQNVYTHRGEVHPEAADALDRAYSRQPDAR